MDPKPGILRILQSDSWAVSFLGGLIYTLVITIIVLATYPYLHEPKSINPPFFIGMTIVSFIAAIFVCIIRVRYVKQVFENGVTVKAQVIKSRAFRSNLHLTLRYTYLSQVFEKKVEQVITGKTRKLRDQTVVDLIIDPENPDRVLIRDVYC